MPGHDIIVIGASAGGVQTLAELVGALPPGLPASIFIVIHVAPFGTSAMPAILSRSGPLPAVHPRDDELIVPGKIYVAPPDHHLLIEPERVRISRGPTENGYRPAVDVLFRTAAQVYGPRAVGVVLTGNLDDGTAGLALIKKYGGIAVVQDPEEADYPGMPRSAIASVEVDHILPLARIPSLLTDLAHQEVDDPELAAEEDAMEIKKELERGEDREGKGSVKLHLPGVWRDAVRTGEGGGHPFPLPHRPRLLSRKPPGQAVRVAGSHPLGRPARPGGERGPGEAHGALDAAAPPIEERSGAALHPARRRGRAARQPAAAGAAGRAEKGRVTGKTAPPARKTGGKPKKRAIAAKTHPFCQKAAVLSEKPAFRPKSRPAYGIPIFLPEIWFSVQESGFSSRTPIQQEARRSSLCLKLVAASEA